MKGNFNYSYTCKVIDKEIEGFEGDLEDCVLQVESIIYNLEANAKKAFETVRETNEDMRRAANEQIDDLMLEIEELKIQISDLVWKNDKLNEEIERLENLLGEEK